MKNLVFLLLILAGATASYSQDKFCDPALQDEVNNYPMKDGAVWLKDFTVKLDAVGSDKKAPEQRYTMVLTANNFYRFVIKSSNKFDGKAKLTIFDDNNELNSTEYQYGKIPEFLDIEIKETKGYHILVSFQDGKKGCAAFAIFFVKNQITP
jgi:hypothetical protein